MANESVKDQLARCERAVEERPDSAVAHYNFGIVLTRKGLILKAEEAYKKAGEETQVYNKHWLDSPWSGFFEGKDPLHVKDTGVHEETLTHIAKR